MLSWQRTGGRNPFLASIKLRYNRVLTLPSAEAAIPENLFEQKLNCYLIYFTCSVNEESATEIPANVNKHEGFSVSAGSFNDQLMRSKLGGVLLADNISTFL